MGSGEAVVDRIAGVYYLNLGLLHDRHGKQTRIFLNIGNELNHV
jgi:hypothetical protein